MQIKSFYFNPLRVCCYVVWDDTKECVIIDPGCSSDNEFERLKSFISDNELKPVKILMTHGHFDHIASAEDAATEWGIDIYMSDKDKDQVTYGHRTGFALGFEKEIKLFSKPSVNIKDGDVLTFGESSLTVIATPGHTLGGVCFYNEKERVLFSGDTLFAGSIGRTDHPGGDYESLIDNIIRKLMQLPMDVDVLPGHGPATDIGHEAATNPFLQPTDYQHITL